ncbi:Rad4-domain-containing protein [Periconia macrospinosa]|uniref:Rad4-domain-containing protein n=1 Tax=Periconia macrospinosa TaxID=97972 RepID=A0A2V1E4L9_9PLEO|nr:Rad4-domain-containing protein [Periconia macrospinosa]
MRFQSRLAHNVNTRFTTGARNRRRKPADTVTPRRSLRRGKSSNIDNGVPDVFQDLLSQEAASQTASVEEDARPLKKRRTTRNAGGVTKTAKFSGSAPEETPADEESIAPSEDADKHSSPTFPQSLAFPPASTASESDIMESDSRVRQTIIDSDESDGSDMEWEDALEDGNDTDEKDATEHEIGDISITLGGDDNKNETVKKKVRRRAITSVDKKLRLDIHKMHILCLLYHVHRRNAWCNDRRVQAALRRIPTPQTLSNLVPNPECSQYQTSKRFVDGMNELKLMWAKRFSITAQGMYKPHWSEAEADIRPFSDFDEFDDPLDLDDFRSLAVKMEGSQDVGAQLFCALLRAIGIETRLVCSLQCLPFASAAQTSPPSKASASQATIVLDPYKTQSPSPSRLRAKGSSRIGRPSRLEQAMGERHPKLSTGMTPNPRKKYHTPYPVYWVEAFNSAHQKWVPIDPLSTFTINSPEKLEPPLNYSRNSLTYAIAFEDDYTAKDVTQRYTKAYNAKTRKFRVESTQHGAQWWKRTMNFFERSSQLDRDQVEDAALARKTAGEGIPKNVQDFKGHPVYVLARHLRHNEVIHPLNQVGKVNVGSSMNPKMELIYRRGDVHTVRSADKWYRMGRDVKDGEQPLKHAKPKRNRQLSIGPDEIEDNQEEIGTSLYAEFQTEVYIPPPVVKGRVPRNVYGNLDLYVPSMCPPGGTHIRHKLASKAARIVGVDYAEAVTGFNFKGRHGTAVVQGVVVAQEYAEAVEAVIDGMIYAQEEAENQQRKTEAIRLWRRFYLGLCIAERINAIHIDGEKGPSIDVQEEIRKADRIVAEKEFAGGFFPEEGETTQPTARSYEPQVQEEDTGGGFFADGIEEGGGGFLADADDNHGPTLQHTDSFGSTILSQQKLRPQRTSSLAGGFMIDEDDYEEEEEGRFIHGSGWPDEPSMDTHHPEGGFIPDAAPKESDAGKRVENSLPSTIIEGQSSSSKSVLNQMDEEPLSGKESTPADLLKTATIVANGEAVVPVASASTVAIDARPPVQSSPQSSPSDVGSLPMEDPDDEDADPDWLVDVT